MIQVKTDLICTLILFFELLRLSYFLRAFIASQITTKTTMPIRIKAHAMPALKMVSTAPQPDKTTMVKNNAKYKDDSLMFSKICLYIKFSSIIPVFFCGDFLPFRSKSRSKYGLIGEVLIESEDLARGRGPG